jgi:hypothetical protein
MMERALGHGLRLLLGLLGAVALGGGLLVGATRLREAYRGSPLLPALAVALICGAAALGGVALLRGAIRGRIVVRRNRPRSRMP